MKLLRNARIFKRISDNIVNFGYCIHYVSSYIYWCYYEQTWTLAGRRPFFRRSYHDHLKLTLTDIHKTTSRNLQDDRGRGLAKPWHHYHKSISEHKETVGNFIKQHLYTYQKVTKSTDLYDLYEKINTHLSNPDRVVALASAENNERIKEFDNKFYDYVMSAKQKGNTSFFGACKDCINFVSDKKIKIKSEKLLKEIAD